MVVESQRHGYRRRRGGRCSRLRLHRTGENRRKPQSEKDPSLPRLQPFNTAASASARSLPPRPVSRRHHAAPPTAWRRDARANRLPSPRKARPPRNTHWRMRGRRRGRNSAPPRAEGAVSGRTPRLFVMFRRLGAGQVRARPRPGSSSGGCVMPQPPALGIKSFQSRK